MPSSYFQRGQSVPIHLFTPAAFRRWLKKQSASSQAWIKAQGFTAKAGSHCLVAGQGGVIKCVLAGANPKEPLYQLSSLSQALPKGNYHLAEEPEDAVLTYLGWGLANYRFTRYQKQPAIKARLLLPQAIRKDVLSLEAAQNQVRDLVNTPTEDMGPEELAEAVIDMAMEHDANVHIISDEALLDQNYPAIHVVGRACTRAPRLIHMSWGNPEHPRLALVGKGVCFDTGGLDMKRPAGMAKMKKDMGGAAHVLALAGLVMKHQLPVLLDLYIPAVENSIAGNAYRPGDVINTRKGLTVEIGNTDAEGRIVLSDALTRASEDKPDLIVDFATLTGAARVALGTDLPALFCNDQAIADAVMACGERVSDPVWCLPLYQPYKRLLKSPIADMNNIGKTSFGGAITAALFLEHFVGKGIPWMHLDTYAWNDIQQPGRPLGGEALGLRALFDYLRGRYAG